MKLFLDIGNSRLKWAFGDAAGFIATGGQLHADAALEQVPAGLLAHGPAVDEIRLVNVSGPQGEALARAVAAHYGRQPLEARSGSAFGALRNGYRHTDQLGADRWLALCAAWARHPGALLVADAGTALTLDVVAGDGLHTGGLIVPGYGMMQAVLRRDTSDLARLAGREPDLGDGLLGRDTAAAMRLGAVRAMSCLVATCMKALQTEWPAARLVLTGGDAAVLAAHLDEPAEIRPLLVLEGLALDPVCFRPG